MLRTAVQRTTRQLVRLRPGLSPVARSSFGPFASNAISRAPTCARLDSRYFSEVPEIQEEHTEEEKEETAQKSKRKRRKKYRSCKREPPSQQQAEQLFDDLCFGIPLKELNAARRKLLKASAKRDANKTTRVGHVHSLLQTIVIPKWAQQPIKNFLLLKKRPNVTPVVDKNKQKWESNVDLLMKTRDFCIQQPFLWGRAKKHKKSARKKKKDEEKLRQEAEEMATLLAERLPNSAHVQLYRDLSRYVEAGKKKKGVQFLKLLKGSIGSHLHLVAFDLADFFHVHHEGKSDVRVQKYKQEWNLARTDFCSALLQVYDNLEETMQSIKQQRQEQQQQQQEKEPDAEDALDQIQSQPLETPPVQTEPKDTVQPIEDTLGHEAPDEQQVKPAEKKDKHRLRRNVYLALDAIPLEWPTTHDASLDRTVFIENLPVDMEEMELLDLYSRCGTISSVEIFNARPELDPGSFTQKKRRELKVKQRIAINHRGKRKKWKRPRTPVYARITFATDEGYALASDAPLCIFGMVVRKHPMRTIVASDMKKLYLQDLPEDGSYAMDVEKQLAELLLPEFYVSMDVGQHDYTKPRNVVLKFQTYEMAHHAYEKLKTAEIAEGATLNWMKTPDDAMKYWTKEFTFDTL